MSDGCACTHSYMRSSERVFLPPLSEKEKNIYTINDKQIMELSPADALISGKWGLARGTAEN